MAHGVVRRALTVKSQPQQRRAGPNKANTGAGALRLKRASMPVFHAATLPSCKHAKPCCRHCRLTAAAVAQAIHLQGAALNNRRVAVPCWLKLSCVEGRADARAVRRLRGPLCKACMHLCDKPCCLGSRFARRSDAVAGCCRLVGGLQFGLGCGGCKASRLTSATSGSMPARKRTPGQQLGGRWASAPAQHLGYLVAALEWRVEAIRDGHRA